ncbi:MAG: hypothetical protein M3N14_07995, partial [Bacteroidota bacterium]|nr:hypothetical protein [Bacteroidota bacterium]
MSRRKKISLLLPIVIAIFFGAYGWHRHEQQQSNIVGRLERREMNEISGIAASGINPDIYYVHNDSDDTSRFFAILPSGKVKSTIYFKGDQNERYGVHDCEDIAVGPGPVKGKSYVYLGDIGDNNAVRKNITVYRMEEKKAWANDSLSAADAAPIHLKYPDGPKDAETLMVDPVENLMYIVSKRQDSVTVYTSPLNFKPNSTVILTKRCRIFFKGLKLFKWITAGDISKDGRQVLMKSYTKVYYWKRDGNEPIWKTLQKPPQILPYQQEKQGEAIGFT